MDWFFVEIYGADTVRPGRILYNKEASSGNLLLSLNSIYFSERFIFHQK